MLKFKRYSYKENKDFIKQIYEESFPREERFSFQLLVRCDKENSRLTCIYLEYEPVGMQFTVRLPKGITYLMYLAAQEKYRNNEIGSKALSDLVKEVKMYYCVQKDLLMR